VRGKRQEGRDNGGRGAVKRRKKGNAFENACRDNPVRTMAADTEIKKGKGEEEGGRGEGEVKGMRNLASGLFLKVGAYGWANWYVGLCMHVALYIFRIK